MISDFRQPIGIFDSGVGGLTVMRQLVRLLPAQPVVYFGDTARVPYGGRSRETIVRYAMENVLFLMEYDIKLLIIACNTAAAFSASKLRSCFKIPIVDVIDAGVSQAVKATSNQRIAVLATRATIDSGVHKKAILAKLPEAIVFTVACPLLVPLAEEHFIDHPAVRLIVKEYLSSIKEQNVDTVLLGCTHYPLLRHVIQEELSDKVAIVDSSSACAQSVATLLQYDEEPVCAKTHELRFYVSDDPVKFKKLAEHFFGQAISHVEKISVGSFH